MKTRPIWIRFCLLGFVLLSLLLCVLFPVSRNWFSGQVMLFSQRSVQTLQGAIHGSTYPLWHTIWLSIFQSIFFFWLPPRQVLAAAANFGVSIGYVSSLTGIWLGGTFWYGLGRLLPFYPTKKAPFVLAIQSYSPGLICGLVCFFGGLAIPILLLFGYAKAPYKRMASGFLLGEAVRIGIYTWICSPFHSLLPNIWKILLLLIGGTIIVLTSLCIWKAVQKQIAPKNL